MDEALSPPSKQPLFHYELLCADYDDEKGKALIHRALHEKDADADAALCEIIFQHLLKERKLPQHLRKFF